MMILLFINYNVGKYFQVAKKGKVIENLFYPTYLHPVKYPHFHLSKEALGALATTPTSSPLIFPFFLQPSKEAALIVMAMLKQIMIILLPASIQDNIRNGGDTGYSTFSFLAPGA